MARRSDWRRRRASLSALASAALAASSGSGEAAIIYQGLGGIGPGAPLPGTPFAVRKFGTIAPLTSVTERLGVGPLGHPKTMARLGFDARISTGPVVVTGVNFRTRLAGKGQTFNQVGCGKIATSLALARSHLYRRTQRFRSATYFYGPRRHVYSAIIPSPYSTRTLGSSFRRKARGLVHGKTHDGAGHLSFSGYRQTTRYSLAGLGNEYALFRFDVGSQTDYGWLELHFGNPSPTGPFIRLIGYAYENTGKPIPAGAIPEPRQLPLALGALGVREWRKKRNAAA